MRILQSAYLLCISLLAIRLLHCHGSCAFFNSECFRQEFDDTIHATLRFTLICHDTTNSVNLIKVTTKEKHATVPKTICQVFLKANESCFPSAGCTCDPVSRQYSVSMAVIATDSTQWELSGYLNGGQMIQSQTGVFDRTYCPLSDFTTDRTLSEDVSYTDYVNGEVTSGSDTPHLTSTIGPTPPVPKEGETGATDNITGGAYHKTKVWIMAVVAVVVVMIVMVVLVLVCKLRKSVKKIKSRPSATGITRTEPRLAHPRMYPALFNKDLYGGSNVSLMISNDMYVEGPWNAPRDVSRARRPLPTPPGGKLSKITLTNWADDGSSSSLCEKEGDYAEINSLLGDSKQGACGGQHTYTDVDEVRTQKTEKPTEKGKDDALH